jgi:NADPH:quinone reductase-like Zn-dependent oxidoreductase
VVTSAGDTMTAAFITRLGPPEEIRFGTLPVPHPARDEVLVRTEALAANHVDTFVRSGAYRTERAFPFVVGRDLVGTVVSRGRAGFEAGDRVWCNSMGHAGRQGSFAEYVAVPAERLYRLPDGVDPVEAVAVLHPAATAQLALQREARLRIGETLLVAGGAGAVGSALVQLAAASGARVITTARAEDAAWCRSCGAGTVLDYRDPALVERLREHAPCGIDVLCDTAGVHDLQATVPLLATGGRIIVLAGMRATPVLPVGALYVRDAAIRGFAISNASVADLARAARAIGYGLTRGILRPRISTRLPLAEAAEAHRLLERGHRGRIVVLP